jgi:hypothetical protein
MGAASSKELDKGLIVDTCREKKAVANAIKAGSSEATELNGVPEFILSDHRIFDLIAMDLPRPRRESAEDYEVRVRRRMGILFASAPKELTLVRVRDGTPHGPTSTTRVLLRIESAPKTKEVHMGLIIRDGEDNFSDYATARQLVLTVCGEMRRTHRKKRVKASCWEEQEVVFLSCGFKRLKAQESLKNYPTSHLKRFVEMERRLLRWDDFKNILLVVALCRDGRASPVDGGLSGELNCIQKVMTYASDESFWFHFLSEALLFAHF